MKEKMTQEEIFASKLIAHMGELFEVDSNNSIDVKELQEGDRLTIFMHCMANVVPTYLYQELTGEQVSMLDFNHIANKLIFQFKIK